VYGGPPYLRGVSTTQRTLSGDLQLPRVILTDPATVAVQSIKDILALWEGDWFLDTGAGFPWLQSVLGVKNPNVTEIKGLLQQAIMFAPYVVSVTAVAVFNTALRAFFYTFQATLNTGQIITGGSNQAFQVQPSGST
jgi:hypothetical protein